MKHTVEDVKLDIEPEFRVLHNRVGVFNTHFQNFGHYNIPKAQLIIADPPYCYDEKTECLTRNGWKKYTELSYDDELLSLNHETQEMCYSGIENIIIRDNDEDMYSFKSDNIDLFVSAKHRCYAVHDFIPNLKFGKRLRNRNRIHKENIVFAEDISAASYIPRSGYVWKVGIDKEFVVIPGCEKYLNATKKIQLEDVKIPINDWLAFFGLWLADGCTTRNGVKGSGYSVQIKQYGDNRQRVIDIMSKLPWDIHINTYKENASNIIIYSKQLYLYLVQFGKSRDKYIPRWILDLPKERLQVFWNAYTFGDSTENGNGLKISTVSPKMIENLQEVALKLGTICQIRNIAHKDWSDTLLYYFQFNQKSRNIRYKNKKVIREYKGKLWCVTLKTNSVFLVRRNGIITFSGNCLGKNAYASNPLWYVNGSIKNGESDLAGEEFFDTDKDFRPAEFMHFCSQMLRPEPKEKGKAPCMVIFCGWEQQFYYKELGGAIWFQRLHTFGVQKELLSTSLES